MTTRNPGETSALLPPGFFFFTPFFFRGFFPLRTTDLVEVGHFFLAVFFLPLRTRDLVEVRHFFLRFFSVTDDRLSGGGTRHILAS